MAGQSYAGRYVARPVAGMAEMHRLRAEVAGTSQHLVAGLSMLSHAKILDTDPEFASLCERMGVPVSDHQRHQLERIDAQQHGCRTRIYDRLLEMEERHPRPILNAAKRMQALYRMVKSKVDVEAKKYRLFLVAQRQAVSTDVKNEMGQNKDEMIGRLAKALSQPVSNRFWSLWLEYRNRCRVWRQDTPFCYSQTCARLGASPCGLRALDKFSSDPYCQRLDLGGLSMTPRAARALVLALGGLSPCTLCKGLGSVDPAMFDAMTDPDAPRKSAGQLFDEMDLDGSGEVDQDELRAILRGMGFNLSADDMRTVWRSIDEDKTGVLEKREFESLFEARGEEGVTCFMCGGVGHLGEQAEIGQPHLHKVPSVVTIRETTGAEQIVRLVLARNVLRASGARDFVSLLCGGAGAWLRVLSLANCELGPEGARALVPLISSEGVPLVELDLSSNALGDDGTVAVCEAASDSETLERLYLARNGVGRGGAGGLGGLLTQSRSLRELDISWNNIRGDGARELCEGLAQSVSLLTLRASWNGLGEVSGCRALREALRWTNLLKTLDLGENRIGLAGARELAQGLLENHSLETVLLRGNTVTPAGASELLSGAHQDVGVDGHLRQVVMDRVDAAVADLSQFDPLDIAGEYSVDTRLETGRRVLQSVMRRIARGDAFIDPERGVTMTRPARDEASPEAESSPSEAGGGDGEEAGEGEGGAGGGGQAGSKDEMVRIKGYRLPGFSTREEFLATYLDPRGKGPISWQTPDEGIVEFTLKDTLEPARPPPASDVLLTALVKTLSARDRPVTERAQGVAQQLQVGDHRLTFSQAGKLLASVSAPDELALVAMVLVNRVIDAATPADVLNLLTEGERPTARALLRRTLATEFRPENPTGRYELDLARPRDRAVAEQLVRMARAQATSHQRLENYYYGRYGGPRDVHGRCWRAATIDGKPFFPHGAGGQGAGGAGHEGNGFEHLPDRGVLRVDFVELRMVKSRAHGPEAVLPDDDFKHLKLEFKQEAPHPYSMCGPLRSLRAAAAQWLFAHAQVADLLEACPVVPRAHLQPRVEVMVALIWRLAEWKGAPHLVNLLLPTEQEAFYRRVGRENVWDETCAVNFHRLDLADDTGSRFVAQELVHLAATEPGSSLQRVQLDGCDFEVPQAWWSNVPRRGVLTCYFTRDSAVNHRVSEMGCYASRSTSPCFEPPRPSSAGTQTPQAQSMTSHTPEWLRPFCRSGSSQPNGSKWIDQHQWRYIRLLMQERGINERHCFDLMDVDKSHTLNLKEITMMLFRLGVFLKEHQIDAFMSLLDNNTGTDFSTFGHGVDHDEWHTFWETFRFL